jgi:hypothetical protein
MRRLADHIETELEEQEVCAVYNSELARVWPKTISPEKRKRQIKRFADAHDLSVTFYDVGLCAVFEKPHHVSEERELRLPLPAPKRVPKSDKRRRN